MTMDVKATDRCNNCHHEFADHEYVKDSITVYRCPVPHVESGYGGFHGGDPRKFFPCGEDSTPEEIANHRKACILWNECELTGVTPEPEKCPSGFIYDDDGKCIAHVLRMPYGVGVYTAEFEQFWEPMERDDDER